jgi:hypothetical protein
MEFSMRNHIRYTALGVALMAGTSLAHAQTIITQEPAAVPPSAIVVTQPAPAVGTIPVQTVETVRTVRSTTMPRQRIGSRRVVRSRNGERVTTTTTTVREGVIAAPAPTPAVQAINQPIYTEVVRAPAWNTDPAYPRLYDVVTQPAAVTQPMSGVFPVTPVTAYRYIYEPDRILVIDSNTGVAVQAIPR